MTPITCLLYSMAAAVLAAVATRLARQSCGGDHSLRCLLTWNLWILGQVAIAMGALSVLVNWTELALPLTLAGLVLHYGVRLPRRSADA